MANSSVDRVLELAKALTNEERAAIADELLSGLDYPGEAIEAADAETAWRSEIRARAERALRGDTKGADATDVHAALDRELTKR